MYDIFIWSKNGLSIEELKKDPNLEFTTNEDRFGNKNNFIFLKGSKSGGYYRDDEQLWYLSGAYVHELLFYLYEKYDALFVDDYDERGLMEMSDYIEGEDFDILVEFTCRCYMYGILEYIGNISDEFEALYRKSEEKYKEMTARRDDDFKKYFDKNEQVRKQIELEVANKVRECEPKESENSETLWSDDELPF